MRKVRLNLKQKRFVTEYAKDHNATAAAKRAGYHPKMAANLMAKAGIKAAVIASTDRIIEKAELTAARVLEEYRRLAFADMRSFFDDAGNLKPIRELTEEQGSLLAGLEVLIKNAKAGDGVTDTVHKFKLWDKTRALESLAKYFKLLNDEAKNTLTDEALVAMLQSARRRTE